MFEAQVPSHLKALKPIGVSSEISEQRGQGATLLTTAGIAGRPLDKSELERYLIRPHFGPKFPRGVLLADSIPPETFTKTSATIWSSVPTRVRPYVRRGLRIRTASHRAVTSLARIPRQHMVHDKQTEFWKMRAPLK